MPKNILDVGHKVIDTIEEGVHTGSNAVHGVNKDIEDQTGQHNFDRNSALEYCVDQKNPIECIRDNLFKTGIHSEPVNEVINWNSVLENCDDPKNTVYCLVHCFDQINTTDCIRENFNHIEKKTENFFMKIYGKACVRDNQCSMTSRSVLIVVGIAVGLIWPIGAMMCLLLLIMDFGL